MGYAHPERISPLMGMLVFSIFMPLNCTANLPSATGNTGLLAILLGNDSRRDLIQLSTTNSQTSENGQSSLIQIRLKRAPTDLTTIALDTSDPGEGQSSANSVQFDSSNWDTPRIIYVNGQDDSFPDGTQSYFFIASVSASDDPIFQSSQSASLEMSNVDNDIPSLEVGGNDIIVHENTTVHASLPALHKQFSVRPQIAAPGSTITIQISSGSQPGCEATPASNTLTFTDSDLSGADYNFKLVQVRATADAILNAGGQRTCSLAFQITANNPAFNNLSIPEKTATVLDDDGAWIRIISNDAHPFMSENNRTRSVSVLLSSLPTGNVTVCLQSSNPAEGQIQLLGDASAAGATCTGAGASHQVIFTPVNWSTPKQLTIQGLDDILFDGDQIVYLQSPDVDTADINYSANYPGISGPGKLTMLNQDNDRHIFMTDALVSANMGGFTDPGDGSIDILSGPDALCNSDINKPSANDYRALLSDGILRTASPMRRNWVLRPRSGSIDPDVYQYINGAIVIFKTDITATAPFSWNSPVNTTINAHWTGLNADWSSTANHCNAWTDASLVPLGTVGYANMTSSQALAGNTGIACNNSYRLICVEQ